jgi:hypothetical protein
MNASSILQLGLLTGGVALIGTLAACHGGGSSGEPSGAGTGGPLPPAPSCEATAKGSTTVQKPVLMTKLKDAGDEAWLASPAVADIDGDGKMEIIVPRDEILVVWNADGSVKWRFEPQNGRIWSSAVVADFVGDPKLEIAIAVRDQIFLLDHTGKVLPGFPVSWEDEMRSLAAGDLDGDGKLELVAAPAHGGPTDMMNAWHADGSQVAGFPPNEAGVSGCDVDGKCYLAGAYDQNVALGDLDGDGKVDVVVGQDDAYNSIHKSTGEAFDANPMFPAKKTPGVRYLFDLAEAKQGYAEDEETALQAHFTNSAPAIADLDGDGVPEVVFLGSVQNASQTDRLKGVGLWALHHDASRLKGWEKPFHAPDYVAGLWDYDGVNVVAATNQVTVADIDPSHPGPEMIFAGFDGRIHAVTADNRELWTITYTTDENVLTGGVVVGDLSGDGIPEIVFTSYTIDDGKGALFILDAGGNILHNIPLPARGAMPVPTLADVDGDGTVEIVVSLKDTGSSGESVQVYSVPGSATNCLLWPTGRGNLLRDAWVRTAP